MFKILRKFLLAAFFTLSLISAHAEITDEQLLENAKKMEEIKQ